MTKLLCFLCAFFLCAAAGAATPPKVTESSVTYLSGKDTVSSLLYLPEGKGPFPAIVAIHEWWGLNDWVKEKAKMLAEKGYAVLAVDLYRGKVATDPDEAHILMRGLPEDRAARDLEAAAAYLGSLKEVDPARVGSIGWCMGGGYSLATALNDSKLAACVICYGRLVTDTATIAKIPCPILGLFGEDDQGITPADVRAFETACKEAGKKIDVTIYKGAGHAFMNENNEKGYRKESTADAWAKIDAFLARTLKK
jgi:carboxymethylenebutenolidase